MSSDITTNPAETKAREMTPEERREAARRADPIYQLHRRMEVGMTVQWLETGRDADTPFAAIVTGVGDRGLSLSVVDKLLPHRFHRCVDGVKFFQDKTLTTHEREEQGAWRLPAYLQWVLDRMERADRSAR